MVGVEGASLGGSFLGIFGRTVLSYWKARREAKAIDPNAPFEFDKQFLGTALFAAASAGAASVLLFPTIMNQADTNGTPFAVFAAAFTFGWFANDATNMLISAGSSTIRVAQDKLPEVRAFITGKLTPEPKEKE